MELGIDATDPNVVKEELQEEGNKINISTGLCFYTEHEIVHHDGVKNVAISIQLLLVVWPCFFPTISQGYAYDANSNLAGAQSDTVGGGYDQSFDYDVLNRLSTVYQGQEGHDPNARAISAYAYDAVGNMIGSGYANGVGHQYTYSQLNRLTDLTVGKMTSGGSINTIQQRYGYTLNLAGHRTQITEHSGRTVNHVFDKLYRLKSETITGDTSTVANNGTISYTHDKVGNRLSRSSSVSSVPSVSQSYTNNDWLDGHIVDDNGNTQSSPSTDYPLITHNGSQITGAVSDIYDFRNKLIRRSYVGGKSVFLSYDADGNRVSKVVLDGNLSLREHHYLVDTNNHTGYAQVVEEKGEAGNLIRSNFYGHDLVKTDFLSEGYERYYQYDGLGSVRALSDANGDITDEYIYDAFGILIDSVGNTPNQYLYTGEQWDSDLGMYFLRARYLNVSSGRFSNMDTYEGRNREPMTLHKYLYTHGNPVSNIDPSGNVSIAIETTFAVNLSLSFNQVGIGASILTVGIAKAISTSWEILPRATLPLVNGPGGISLAWPHFLVTAENIRTDQAFRYEVQLTQAGLGFCGQLQRNAGGAESGEYPTFLPAYLSDTAFRAWQATLGFGPGADPVFATQSFDYSWRSNCATFAARAHALALLFSLIPF